MSLKKPDSRSPQPIRFAFDERKATAAAAFLLEQAGGSLEYFTLIKLMYFADRESLDAFGRPISGDRFVSMANGPALSTVYNLIKQVVPMGHSAALGPNRSRVTAGIVCA